MEEDRVKGGKRVWTDAGSWVEERQKPLGLSF